MDNPKKKIDSIMIVKLAKIENGDNNKGINEKISKENMRYNPIIMLATALESNERFKIYRKNIPR